MTQNEVYLAAHKTIRPGFRGISDAGICLLDKTRYHHTELCIGNPLESVVPCYSASGMDGGVRKKYMQMSRDKWDAFCLPFAKADAVLALYEKTKNAKYDYLGVGRFAFPWLLREHSTRYFCSEWSLAAIDVHDPWRFSPAGCVSVCLSMGAIQV